MCVNNMTTDYQLELYSIRFEREHFIKLNFTQMVSAFSNAPRRPSDYDQDKRQANQ